MSEPQSSGARRRNGPAWIIPGSDRGKTSDLFMPWFAANISSCCGDWSSAWPFSPQAIVASLVGACPSPVCFIAIAGKRGSAPTLVLAGGLGFNGNRVCGIP